MLLLQGMFLLLVTNRGSNILEDLDTLRMLSKLVPEYAGSALDEEAISRAAFDLIFAFDEVISHGHKENITVQQVKQNCEMESHEEKLHKMIIQSKINDTKDIMKRKAIEIDKHKMEQKRSLPAGPGYNPVMGGMGGGGMGSSSMSRPIGMDMDAGETSSAGSQLQQLQLLPYHGCTLCFSESPDSVVGAVTAPLAVVDIQMQYRQQAQLCSNSTSNALVTCLLCSTLVPALHLLILLRECMH